MNALKNFGTFAAGLAVLIALVVIADLFIMGAAAVSAFAIPWLTIASEVTLGVCILILAPMCAFRASRIAACFGFLAASFVFGFSAWVWGFLVTYTLWGVLGVILGVFLGGIGVVPVAILAAAIHGLWAVVVNLIILAGLTYGSRALALAVAEKVDNDALSLDRLEAL